MHSRWTHLDRDKLCAKKHPCHWFGSNFEHRSADSPMFLTIAQFGKGFSFRLGRLFERLRRDFEECELIHRASDWGFFCSRQQAPSPRQGPPSKRERSPLPRREQTPPLKNDDLRVTSLRQAFEILEIPPGKITLSAAREAYKRRMNEYHPDKTSHLGHELRELSARKALQISLAWRYIQLHCQSV